MLNEKTVIITGVSGGLGLALAKRLINAYDCRVIGIARNRDKVLSAAKELTGSSEDTILDECGFLGGKRFVYSLFDVTDVKKWEEFATLLQKSGVKPDVLINNAGMMLPFASCDKYSDGDVDMIVETNLKAVVTATRKLYPLMSCLNEPTVVNIVSAGGLCPVAGQSLYCATKYAIRGFGDVFRTEHKKFHVCAVYPGFIKTDIMRRQKLSAKEAAVVERFMLSPDKAAKRICKAIAHKRKHRVIGVDGHMLSFFGRVAPITTSRIIAWIFRMSGLELFADVT